MNFLKMPASLDVSNICIRTTLCSIQLGCIIACLYIIVTHFEKYHKNDDASAMHVKPFPHGGSNIFPSITFCFQSGHIANSLEGFYNETSIHSQLQISVEEYRDILLGKIEGGKNMEDISSFDFERNTLNIWNYLEKFKIQDTNRNKYIWKYDETEKKVTFEYENLQKLGWNEKQNIDHGNKIPLVPNYLDPEIKCFTHQHFLEDGIMINTIKFYFSVEKLKSTGEGRMYIYVHQFGQLIRNMLYLYKIDQFSEISRDNLNNKVVLNLMSLKVVKNRHDSKEACNNNLKNDDQEWMKQVTKNVSCLPPFWSSVYDNDANFPLCRSKKELQSVAKFQVRKNAYGRNMMFQKYNPPCQIMKVLANSHTTKYKKDGVLEIGFLVRYLKRNTPPSVNCVLYI